MSRTNYMVIYIRTDCKTLGNLHELNIVIAPTIDRSKMRTIK